MVKTDTMTEVEKKQLVHDAVEQVKDKVPSKLVPMIEDALIRIQKEGLTPAEAMGISPEFLEEIYECGYHFFQSGKYKDALLIFNFLVQLSAGSDHRFTFGIAAAHHHLKEYPEAAGYYMIYNLIHPLNPLPYYHLHDCFKKMNSLELALSALQTADKLAATDPKNAALKAKIELELRSLQSTVASALKQENVKR